MGVNRERLRRELQQALSATEVVVDHAIGPMTTYRVGGSASLYVEPQSVEDLAALAQVVARHRPPVLVLGRGSNLLAADEGVDALVVHLPDQFATIEANGSTVVVGGAASLPTVARRLTGSGSAGFEWAVGVPGSVGGAVRMNAGGHGSDMAAALVSAEIVDLHLGETSTVRATDLHLGYRRSAVRAHQVVRAATLELAPGDPERGRDLLAEIVTWRREHQPGGQNAGSVFTNPSGDSAGRIIDAAGLRGLRIGSAAVSTKHANFIQADPDGRAADIVALMQEVVRRVLDHAGVTLETETHLAGFDPDLTVGSSVPVIIPAGHERIDHDDERAAARVEEESK